MLMIGKQLTAAQRLEKSVRDLLSKDYFVPLSGVLLCVQHAVDTTNKIKTAATNGVWCKYGEAFVDSLTDAELRFLVLHETYHCMYNHITTWGWMYKEGGALANKACDHVINLQILEIEQYDRELKGFLVMPKGGCADRQFLGMDSPTVYKKLKEQQEQEDEQDGGEGQGEGEGEDGEGQGGQAGDEADDGFDEHDWDAADKLSAEDKAENARQMDEAVRQGALLASKSGKGGDRVLGDMLAAKVRWQDALREYLQATCAGNEFSTWRKPNRRFVASGIYMPSGVSEIMGELVVAVDMSGSIGDREVAQFLGEITAICETVRPEKLRLLYWDTAVCQDEKYEREELINLATSTRPAGGGGTSPSCITDYMRSECIKPQVCVVLTDGYVGSDWGGDWPCPVLWCIAGNKSVQPTTGSAVHIDWNN